MLGELLRVGERAIVSFPNFGYWPHRTALLRGKMPVSKSLPYEWYDTPNLRCATIYDFADLATDTALLDWARTAAPVMLDQYPGMAEKHVNRWLGGREEFLKA